MQTILVWLFYISVFAGGYAASIFTWPWIKVQVNGIEAEIDAFKAKIAALKAKL